MKVGLAAAAAFVGTILLANWLIVTFGLVPVGFGLLAPAGVFAAGLAFTLRDVVHRCLGPWAVMAAILAGAALSLIVSPTFAVASAAAFLTSELMDLAVFTPLHRRSWLGAVIASNTVGLVVDSIVFLTLAFGSLQFLAGQVVGKAWVTAATVVLIVGGRRALLARDA
jgi:queuosine precursor transporter